MFASTKVVLFLKKHHFLAKFRFRVIFTLIFNTSYLVEFQSFIEMLQKSTKKNQKKCIAVLKKYLPLHRFNKQMIVLQF